MTGEKTIAALKTNFLRQQIRILSQPLKLSDKAKQRSEFSDNELRDVMLKGVYEGLESKYVDADYIQANQIVRRHNNAVFDRVAVSNVATQIEQLFWYSSEPDDHLAGGELGDDGVLRIGDDLADADNIHKLSTMFDEDEQSTEFAEALALLQDLSEKQQALKRKLERYKRLQRLLEPLENPQQSVQPNLVTRDGPLADELARSKTLGIRVAGGLARRNERGERSSASENGDIDMVDEGQKVAALLKEY
ncbi:uncharacterized protein PV09_08191 [Verruconis gallopava]|uniref:Kinetochore protein fta4 n=1 Tax=Verruconis gallopava TaxID=253628 RepID=A0A0D1XDJ2_9PEZI|nr:uncharacterized protein PV09_08191 [Verruconis gallopava]KIW00301.1 hypothetical protein PV09_08191 [Verruconis gallopava]